MAEPGKDRDPPVQPLDGRLRIRRGRLATRRPYADVMRQRGNQYHQHMAKRAQCAEHGI